MTSTKAQPRRRTKDRLDVVRVPGWELDWLIHGFSTRLGGVSELNGEPVLSLAFTNWDARKNVEENRRRFQTATGSGISL